MTVGRLYGMFVYVIQAGEDGPLKIGVANDPLVRLKELQTANPIRLRLLESFSGGPSLEREIHLRLAPFRVSGEWFKSRPEVWTILRKTVLAARERGPQVSTRYVHCTNCGALAHDSGGWVLEGESSWMCDPCAEFAAVRASGRDPFDD